MGGRSTWLSLTELRGKPRLAFSGSMLITAMTQVVHGAVSRRAGLAARMVWKHFTNTLRRKAWYCAQSTNQRTGLGTWMRATAEHNSGATFNTESMLLHCSAW